MYKKKNQCYETPWAVTVEVRHEGIICASEVNGGNSIKDWGDGGTTNDEIFF